MRPHVEGVTRTYVTSRLLRYLTGDCAEFSDFYEPDVQALVYRSEEEMLEEVTYCLAHEDAAGRVRHAGDAGAMHDHSHRRRWRVLLDKLTGAH